MTKPQINKYDDIVEKANLIHNNVYQYKGIHIKTTDKRNIYCLKIFCPIHNYDFIQPINAHIGKNTGCPLCGQEKRKLKINNLKIDKNYDSIVQKANVKHNNEYTYGKIFKKLYVNRNYSCIEIFCKIHGKFEQRIQDHIGKGTKCPQCNPLNLNLTQIIKDANLTHNNEYTYGNLVNGKNLTSNRELEIFCKMHGKFLLPPHQHIKYMHGCPYCKSSKGETKIQNVLKLYNIKYTQEYTFEQLKGLNNGKLRFDFYLPDFNTCIEYQGEQHYKPCSFGSSDSTNAMKTFISTIKHDEIKKQYCKNNNIKLIEIPYWDFDDIDEIIKYSLNII